MNFKIGALSTCILLFTTINVRAQPRDPLDKPNIIFILADDLGYGDVGFNGQAKIKTPNLDRMAANGMVFTQHYAGSTVCGPSRASLLTGKHTGHSELRGNPGWTSIGKPVDMPASEITIAEELKRAGYQTGIVGKWGLAEAGLNFMPLSQGFDYFYGFRKHKDAHNYYPDILWENNDPFHPKGNEKSTHSGQYSHDSIASKALQFVERNAEKPFFLYLAFTTPHFELTVPEDSKEPYRGLGWKKREMAEKQGRYYHDAEGNLTYAGMVSRMDWDVGRLIDRLDELGLTENTIVIFTSDNGHEYDNGFFDSNGPFRGKKRDLYEGGIRMPFVAYWPGRIKAGRTTDHISGFWDFLPTACELAGTTPKSKSLDGISYVPTLLGNEQKSHPYLYWEFREGKGSMQAVRMDDWKAVRFYQEPLELYDLSVDPGESEDLSTANPDVVEKMDRIFGEARTENQFFPLFPRKRD